MKSTTPMSSGPPKNFPYKYLGIAWQLNQLSGWGVYGFNLAIQLERMGVCKPVLFSKPDVSGWVNPLHRTYLEPAMVRRQSLIELLERNTGEPVSLNTPVLYALGNQLGTGDPAVFPSPLPVGMVFCEDTRATAEALERSKNYRLLVAGSQWNAELLKAWGCENVRCVPQGIDPTNFHPGPRCHYFRDRFVVFSGGKLEYRKGQDLVVAAFRKFQSRRPEAMLMTAWHNLWPQFMAGLDAAGQVNGVPEVLGGGELAIAKWLTANGVPSRAILDLGSVPNYVMGQVLREADVAIFPNRCEGGTNLVAMECMACGLPTILAANTGQLDLIADDNCYPLRTQRAVAPTAMFAGTDGWGESDVDEMVEALEAAYRDRDQARARGAAAARFMEDWTWERQVAIFMQALSL